MPAVLSPAVDPSLLKDLISSATALAAVLVSGFSVFQVARTAQKSRSEQRAADAYLTVLRLVEQEAEWTSLSVEHLAYDRAERAEMGVPSLEEVPKPVVADRATAAAYLAAYGSAGVRAKHAKWREAADHLYAEQHSIREGINAPEDRPSAQMVYHLLDEFLHKEIATRQALEDAIAKELRHR